MKPAKLQPTDDSYLDERIRTQIAHITPRLGIIEGVHPNIEDSDTSNYKVDVRVTREVEGEGETQHTHEFVPVAVSHTGSVRGLQEGDMVFVEYRRGNPERPIVTRVLYDDNEQAPQSHPGDYREKIGDDAVIEVVTDEDGDRRINIGKQTTDRDGIDAGLSINLADGSFSLMNEGEHGLFVDGDGNSILKWESMAMPWGASGDVSWDENFAPGDGGDEETHTLSVSVEDSGGQAVEGATVSINQASVEGSE